MKPINNDELDKLKVVIIGVGLMGSSIAASAAIAGHPTVMIGRSEKKAHRGIEKAYSCIDQLRESGLIGGKSAADAKAGLTGKTDLEGSCRAAGFILEAVPEVLSLKQDLFAEVEGYTDKHTIIASTTSGTKITDISTNMQHPGRAVTAHFWFPGHLVPLVEVVIGDKTTEATARYTSELLKSWGKTPVIVKKDLPGQLANRIQQAVIREAVNLVAEGIASPEDVDTAIKASFGIRFPVWGPLEHIDAVGLDLATQVQRDVLPSLDNRPVPEYLNKLVDKNTLGYKTGGGFYDWSKKNMDEAAALRDEFIMHSLLFFKNRGSRSSAPRKGVVTDPCAVCGPYDKDGPGRL
jgi:3-hydroxybutyryl-CoA dehydrogenase